MVRCPRYLPPPPAPRKARHARDAARATLDAAADETVEEDTEEAGEANESADAERWARADRRREHRRAEEAEMATQTTPRAGVTKAKAATPSVAASLDAGAGLSPATVDPWGSQCLLRFRTTSLPQKWSEPDGTKWDLV